MKGEIKMEQKKIEKVKNELINFYETKKRLALDEKNLTFHSKSIVDFFEKHAQIEPFVKWTLMWLNESAHRSFICFNLSKFWSDYEYIPLEFQDFKNFFIDLKSQLGKDYNLKNLVEDLEKTSCVKFIKLENFLQTDFKKTDTPFVLTLLGSDYKLYLSRAFSDEMQVKNYINQTSHKNLKSTDFLYKISEKIKQTIDFLFANNQAIQSEKLKNKKIDTTKQGDKTQPDWQKIAIAQMLTSQFGIITGGPGTGKTTTVLRFIATVQILNLLEKKQILHIVLSAPTGKASARLWESIEKQINELEEAENSKSLQKLAKKIDGLEKILLDLGINNWSQILPKQVSTLHRVLGAYSLGIFDKGEHKKLNLDLLIIDEASMIDLNIFSNMLNSLPSTAKLYLLGDENQLSSVEAGSVLGDLCSLNAGKYTKADADFLEKLCGEKINSIYLDENANYPLNISKLHKSYRFDSQKGIGKLADLVNKSDRKNYESMFEKFKKTMQTEEGLNLIKLVDKKDLKPRLIELANKGWEKYFAFLQNPPSLEDDEKNWDDWAKKLFDNFSQFQFLVVTREGDYGFKRVNYILDLEFGTKFGKVNLGKPYMVRKNDPLLGVNNGDLGIYLPYKNSMQLHFLQEGRIRRIAKSRIEELDAAWSLTVHKSQGSEFKAVCLILSAKEKAILTKEILYTGLTRAKKDFILIYEEEKTFKKLFQKNIDRWSGF